MKLKNEFTYPKNNQIEFPKTSWTHTAAPEGWSSITGIDDGHRQQFSFEVEQDVYMMIPLSSS
jgi:hypothetical protein